MVEAQAGPADIPEVQKTVQAFIGHWNVTGTATDPGSTKPSQVTGTLDCERALGGMAVRCRVVNAVTGGEAIEVATIVGFSPDDRRVHLLEADSSGLYHEHRGQWRGTVIRFERLVKPVAGKHIVEEFAIGFPAPGQMTISSIERSADGTATLSLVCTRE